MLTADASSMAKNSTINLRPPMLKRFSTNAAHMTDAMPMAITIIGTPLSCVVTNNDETIRTKRYMTAASNEKFDSLFFDTNIRDNEKYPQSTRKTAR